MNFVSRWLEARRASKDVDQVIDRICDEIVQNWDTAETKALFPHSYSQEYVDKTFTVGRITFNVWRTLGGDLVRVYLDDKEIAAFVDQAHAYSGLMGINDITVDIKYNDFVAALEAK